MRIVDFIVCDDVRQEVGNKKTLVGVYDSIQISGIAPDKMDDPQGPYRMGFYFQIDFEGAPFVIKKYGAEFSVDGSSFREVMLLGDVNVSSLTAPTVGLAFLVSDFVVPKGNLLEFKVILESEKSERIKLPVSQKIRLMRISSEALQA